MDETVDAFSRKDLWLQRWLPLLATLRPGGVLLCRLNSTNDHEFGASGHAEIEPHYYMVDGEPKRFFDRAAVERLFASGWRILGLEEHIIHRYDRPKSAWEAVLEPA